MFVWVFWVVVAVALATGAWVALGYLLVAPVVLVMWLREKIREPAFCPGLREFVRERQLEL